MNVMDLVAKISLDSQEYEKGVGQAQSSFAGLGSSIASGAKTIAKVGVGAFMALGTAIVGSTTALIKNASETAKMCDEIDKQSQKLGITTESYQEWDFVLQHCGSSVDSLKGGMKTMRKEFESARDVIAKTAEADAELERQLESGEITLDEYNKAYDELYDSAYQDVGALGKLGFSLQEIADMSEDPDLAFKNIIAKLQEMPEGAERTALATELLGKSAQELAPLLNMSADETAEMVEQCHELGGVMDDEAVKAGANFQDSLTNLKTTLTGAKNNLMTEFLPSLTTVMDGLTALFSGDDSGIGKIKQGIEDFANKLNEKLPKVLETIGGIAESLISALPSFFDAIASQLPSLIQTLIPVLINAVVGLADAIEKALPEVLKSIESNISVITSGLSKILTSVGKIILKLVPVLLPMLIRVGLELIKALAQGFTENASEVINAIVSTVNVIIQELTNPETLTTLLECGIQIILAIVQGIMENLPLIIECMLTLVGNILSWFITDGAGMLLSGALDMFKSIGDGLLKAWDYIVGKIGELFGNILGEDGIGGWGADIIDKALGVFEKIGDGISQAWENIKQAVMDFGGKIWQGIKDGVGDLFKKGQEMVEKIVEGIKSVWHKVTHFIGSSGTIDNDELKEKMKEAGYDVGEAYYEGQAEALDVHSPSRKMMYLGEMTMKGFSEGIVDEADDSKDDIDRAFDDLNSPFEDVLTVDKKKTSAQGSLASLANKLESMMSNQRPTVIPVYIGNRQIDEIYVDSKQRVTLRSGGQVNV